MTDVQAYFASTWPLLQQAALYRPNPTFHNPAWGAAGFRVLIVRLSPFRDVDRSTPHLFLFQAVRRVLPDAYIDMAFFPPEHDRRRLQADGVPLLVGVQSWRSLQDFDVVLVSNAYTLELINLPYLLQRSGAPVLAGDRDASWPPIILGGSNALATQSMLTGTGDAVVDALFFGEGEGQVGDLVRALAEADADRPRRERLLRAAEGVTGLWVANGPPDQQVTSAVCDAPRGEDLLTQYPLLDSGQAGTARLQISFGCPAFCSFCFEGYGRKPYREVPRDALLAAARRLKRRQGAEALDLYSFNVNTHADVLALLLGLNRQFDRVHLKSQRVDMLAAMPGLLDAEVAADKRSFTLGVEGISRRMRAFLHKSLADPELMDVLARLLRHKIREVKLFYILTGHEDADDLAEFREVVRDLKAMPSRRGVRVIFSFGLLVRMPFTPLRYDRLFLEEDDWRQIVGPVKATCETNGFEFRLATSWEAYATSQVLALGGTWLHRPVLALAEAGHCYDLTLSPGYWPALRRWMEEHGHWTPAFLGEKGPDAAFPLGFVAPRVDADVLYRQYRRAQQGVDRGYCLGEVGRLVDPIREARCLGCGACTTPEQRRAITEHAMQHPGLGYLSELEALMRRKWRRKPLYARLWLPPEAVADDPAWTNAWVMQALFEAYPELVDALLRVQERVFTVGDAPERFANLHGESVFALTAWEPAALAVLARDEAPAAPHHAPLVRGVQFRGWVEAFEPGQVRQAELHLTLPTAHFPDAGDRLRRFLQDAYVPVNVRRAGAGYRFDLSKKARKKRVLLGGEYHQDARTFEARLRVSLKFDLLGYLQGFGAPGRWREASVEVVRLEI
jgi:radical SAM superfamily enzyme YgiQ (UPF0313 family)